MRNIIVQMTDAYNIVANNAASKRKVYKMLGLTRVLSSLRSNRTCFRPS